MGTSPALGKVSMQPNDGYLADGEDSFTDAISINESSDIKKILAV